MTTEMPTAKSCFKCGITKPLDDFYAHPRMADGHLNKCKDCARKDSSYRLATLQRTSRHWVLQERVRCRIKSARQRDKSRAVVLTPEQLRERSLRYYDKYPEKRRATTMVGNAIRDGKLKREPCEVCGSQRAQAHHDDYSKPLEVRWLCTKHHAEYHINLRKALL